MLVVLEPLWLLTLAQSLHLVCHCQEAGYLIRTECATDDDILHHQRAGVSTSHGCSDLTGGGERGTAHAVEVKEIRLLGVHAAAGRRVPPACSVAGDDLMHGQRDDAGG